MPPTVASPKYAAPLRDIPQTIEVIPRAAMEAQGVTTLSEALRNVPGITLQAGEGGGASSTAGDMFNMRGFNASNSLFVDNVRDDGLVSRDVFNLEQVEVFMGPTGSDVGRGTAAGYVNMQTKTPHLPTPASATLTYGTANQRRGTHRREPARSRRTASDSWLSKSAVRLNVAVAGQRRRGPRRGGERDQGRSRRRSASASGPPPGCSHRRRSCARTTCPTTAFPAPRGAIAARADDACTPARPVDQSNYYGSPAFDYDDARPEHGHRAASSTISRRGGRCRTRRATTGPQREAIISTVQNVAAYVPATDLVTIARQGNVRENTDHLEPDEPDRARYGPGGIEHNISSGLEFAREAQFAPALDRARHARAGQHLQPEPERSGHRLRARRGAGAFTDGTTDTAALFAFDSLSLGTARPSQRRPPRFEHYDTEFRSVDAPNVTTAEVSVSDGLVSGKAGVVFRLHAKRATCTRRTAPP